MSNSRKVGPFRVRPHIRDGVPTGKWFVDIPASLTGSGKRKRKLFDNQRTALEVARQLNRRIDPMSGRLVPQERTSGLRFSELVGLWQADEELRVKTRKKRASTFRTDCNRLKALMAFFGDVDIAAITPKNLTEYQHARLTQGRKPNTINGEMRALALVMRWAVREGFLSEGPKTDPIPVPPKREDIPTQEEVARLIEALPQRLRPLVRFLAETGCRKGEALNLTWDCVDEVNGYVEIRSREGWTPKTAQSERSIPINRSLLELLRSLPKNGQFVFPGQTPDKPITNFRKSLENAVVTANIRRQGKLVHITPQTFRKANATWQAMRGINESVLQGLLGHAKGSTVTKQFYVHATEKAMREAVLQLPVVPRRKA